MAGVSSPAYRVLCQEKGADLTFTEMVSAKGILMNNKETWSLLDRADGEHRVAAQIFGRVPHEMALAARAVEESGFRLVDINMGCPVRKIVSTGAGAALMQTPSLAAEIVAAVRESVSIPVTAKIRSGWDAQTINAVDLSRRLEAAGAAALIVHARTRAQGYSGKADWSVIAGVVSGVTIPVVGNGDVIDGSSAQSLLEITGCQGIMIGRAALGNPWIFEEIKAHLADYGGSVAPSPDDRYLTCLRHLEGTIEESGRKRGVRRFRTYAMWYTKGLEGAAAARRQIQKARDARDMMAVLRSLYGIDETRSNAMLRRVGDRLLDD